MPANNPYKYEAKSSISPAADVGAITPSDSTDLTNLVRDIRVGGDGNVVVVTSTGAEVTFSNCTAGERLGPFFVARVKATGTTATGLVGYL